MSRMSTSEAQTVQRIQRQRVRELRDPVICSVCEEEFTPMYGRVYCSPECYYTEVKERNRRNRYANHS